MSPLTYGAAQTVSTKPMVAYSQLFHNGQRDRNETATIKKEIKHHNTYTYSVEKGIDTGLAGTWSAGLQDVVGASAELSVKFSTSWGSTKTETTETTYSLTQVVTIPPESTVQVLLVINEDYSGVRLGYCVTEAHSWARGGTSASAAAMTSLWNAQTAEARAAAAAPARHPCSRLGGSEARALAYGSPCGGFKSRPSPALQEPRETAQPRPVYLTIHDIPVRKWASENIGKHNVFQDVAVVLKETSLGDEQIRTHDLTTSSVSLEPLLDGQISCVEECGSTHSLVPDLHQLSDLPLALRELPRQKAAEREL
ncbi:hypothetical protein HPB47_010594 [Ixodes persulcatus]|uniref:Uncharacterized protein n=1 Tax=Ixodes persulcatus TaxID=34615 RepID=A0AC60NYW5_IXOPE|nr:hypothetical protein HPB47_010594 [Ixodes persulcatus]